MTHYIQETDSKMVYAVPLGTQFSFRKQLADETFGGSLFPSYLPLPVGQNTLTTAWELSFKLGNKGLADETRKILSVIQQTFGTLCQLGVDLSYLPALQAFVADDGSFLLEWIFSEYRIGFSVEPDAEESSWFLITNKNLGEISASGFIAANDLNSLVLWLLNFILSHS